MFMDQAWDSVPGPRPSTASVRVRELGWQGWHNPCPESKDTSDPLGGLEQLLVQESLSPAWLKALAQVDDLHQASRLELCADTRESSLSHLGVHLPNLRQLKLNGSRLGSVRDLGTSLGHLQVLWLARCGLSDLDGMGSFPALKELYVAYNDVSDLSPLCLLETLEVLDLEGNSVEELAQVRYLQLCPRLSALTLEGNPVCLRPSPGPAAQQPRGYNYRAEVRRLLPRLQVLDDVPATCTEQAAPRLGEDWLMVKEAIKASSAQGHRLSRLDRGPGPPVWRLGPEQSWPESQPQDPRLRPLPFLVPRGPLAEGLCSEDPSPDDDASNLTHGAGPVLCGNPTKGLRERRHQSQAWVSPEQCPQGPDGLATAARALGSQRADRRELLAVAGLGAWRELRLRPLPPRLLDPQMEEAPTLESTQGDPKGQEETACPHPPSVAPGSQSDHPTTQGEDPHWRGGLLTPSPPRFPPRPGLGSWAPTEMQFRGRRLRALGSLGQEQAAVNALRALSMGSGPSLRGRPGPKPAPDAATRPQVSGTCHT